MTNGKNLAYPVVGNYSTSLTKREYFAGMAMQGLASCITFDWTKVADTDSEACAIRAVQYADALIAELNKTID